jgi:LmbE family N-acetylglucosaminyl deacetylase
MNSILIIAAHPDDEVLGMGGTIKKLSKFTKIHLCVVTEGASAQYKNKKMIKERKDACKKSAKILGISDISFLEFTDMKLDTIPHLTINRSIEKIIQKIKPTTVYTTPYHDLNKDHRIVYESTLVATRPSSSSVKNLFSYEIPGFSKEPFTPNVYVDISDFIPYKIKAFEMYKSEIHEFPHARSIESIETLSKLRGIESGLQNAESFKLIKSIC